MLRLVSKITKIANPGKIGGKTGLRKGEKDPVSRPESWPWRMSQRPGQKGKQAEKSGRLVYTTCFAAPADRAKSILKGEGKRGALAFSLLFKSEGRSPQDR